MQPEHTRRTAVTAVLAAGLLAFLAALAGLHTRATYGAATTADEPYYLVTAQSLVEDNNLDIDDELSAQPLPWHEITMDEQTVPLTADGQRLSPHDPLLPALLAPAMAIGGWIGAKAWLAVLAGLTAALATWTAIRRLEVRPLVAGVVTTAAFAGMPLASYGTQVYPELPAALVVLTVVAALLAPGNVEARPAAATRPVPWRRRFPEPDSWSSRHRVVVVLGVIALPWLAVKYAPVAAVLAALGLWRSVREDQRTAALADVVVMGLAGVVFLVVHQRVYGGWTVYAAGDHFVDTGELSVVGTGANPLGRVRRLTGLLVDQRFGIAAWAPIWLLTPVAVATQLWQRSTTHGDAQRYHNLSRWWVSAVLLAPLAVGWLTATFVALTMHGFWSPGRQVVVVLPLVVLLLSRLADRVPGMLTATIVLGLAGATNWLALAREASTGQLTMIVDFTSTAAWPYRLLAPLLPDGIRGGAGDDLLLGLWSLALVASVAITVRRVRSRRPGPEAQGQDARHDGRTRRRSSEPELVT